MPKKNMIIVLLAGLLVGFLMTSTIIISFYIKRQKHLDQRYHLLCEVLQPSMSVNEVLKTLKQFGDIRIDGDETRSNTYLFIVFENPEVSEVYGSFYLGFSDYKYVRAYDLGFDSQEIICDFRH